MASVTYRNTKTGKYATYSQPNRRLEKSSDWEKVKNRKPPAKKASSDGKS